MTERAEAEARLERYALAILPGLAGNVAFFQSWQREFADKITYERHLANAAVRAAGNAMAHVRRMVSDHFDKKEGEE